MDAGSTHNVQPYGATMEHHAPGALVDRRTKGLLSKEQAVKHHHHQVVEYEKQVQAQVLSHAAANQELHNENQTLRHYVAQLKSQFETVMHAQAQAQQNAAMIDKLRADNHALHVQVAHLKNELEVNIKDYHHSYLQLQHRSENEKRDLQNKEAALEAELNQYKSATSMFSGMSIVDAQCGVTKLRQELAQAVKARQQIMKTADDAVKKNAARCKATIDRAKDTIARLTRERNDLEATNNVLIDLMPTADAKMQEMSTRHLLESANFGSSLTMMPRRNAGNHTASTRDLLASFRPNQTKPAQHHVTIDLNGEYPSPAETPANRNMLTTYANIGSPPVVPDFNNAVQAYTDEAQAQFAPGNNMFELFPGALQMSDLPFGHDFSASHTSLAQPSSSPGFDSAVQTRTSATAYQVAPDRSGLLETSSTLEPFSMPSIFDFTPRTHTEVAASFSAPAVSDTVDSHAAGAKFPILFASDNPIDTSIQVTVSPGPVRTETPFSAHFTSVLDLELKAVVEQERVEAEAVAEAEAAWMPYGFTGYLNGGLEQIKESYGDDVKGYRCWLLNNHAQRKRQAQRDRAAMESKELGQLEEGQAESESNVGETVESEG